jgi:hypothetical protein
VDLNDPDLTIPIQISELILRVHFRCDGLQRRKRRCSLRLGFPVIAGEVCALEVDDNGIPGVLGGGERADGPQQGAVITRVWLPSLIVSCRGGGGRLE